MAYSSVSYTIGAGEVGQTTFDLVFTGDGDGYLDRSHIYMYVNGVQTGGAGGVNVDGFTFTTNTQVELKTYSPVLNDVILFRRIMPKGTAYIDFVDGAGITEQNLDDVHLGLLYIMHETYDGYGTAADELAAIIAAANAAFDISVAASAAAQAAAEAAQALAETAQTAAETAQTEAETAETNAETAQTAAEVAQAAAEAAAAGVNLPSITAGTAGEILQVNAAEDGFELAGHMAGFRNKIINGNFSSWQRGTSQTTSGYGSDDRWLNSNIGSTKTHSRQDHVSGQTDVPDNPKYFSRTVVSSVAGAGNFTAKVTRMESALTLAGKTATLSFYAKADSSKNIAVCFQQYFGTGGSPSTTVTDIGVTTFSLTSTFQKFTVTVDIPSISGKTLGTDNTDHLELRIWFEAGSNFDARTNSLGQQSGTFYISQVQLEEGSVATPFEQRPLGLELALCQRYCERIHGAISGYAASTTIARCGYQFRVTKRAVPTLTLGSVGSTYVNNLGGNPLVTEYTLLSYTSVESVGVNFTVASGLTAGQGVTVNAIDPLFADAEL